MTLVRHTHLIDKSFDTDKISEYSLRIKLLKHGIQLSVIDTGSKRCLVVEDNEVSEISVESIRSFISNHSFAAAGFWKEISIAFTHNNFALVPFGDYTKQEQITLAATSFNVQSNESLLTQNLSKDRLTLLFTVQQELIGVFDSLYPNVQKKYSHHIGNQINSIYLSNNKGDKNCFGILERNMVSLFVTEGDQVLFANSFEVKEKSDLAFFVLYVFKHHLLNQETTNLSIFGTLTPGGEVYQQLAKFIGNITLGKRPATFKFGYQFDELAEHRLLDIIS
jgi:hypothetical protein